MKLLEIKLFPLIRRKVVLDTTKEDFISILEELRKESYMLFDGFSDGGKHKQYSLRWYSKFFILESLYKFSRNVYPFPLFMTRIYGGYKTIGSRLTLSYFITFDITGCVFFAGALFCLFYFFCAILKADHFDFMNGFAMLAPYALFIYGFNSESYGDKKFMERLLQANSKK